MGPVVLAAAALSPALARAGERPPVFVDRHVGESQHMERHAEFSMHTGYGYGMMRHPNFLGEEAGGFFLEVDVGVALNKYWSIGGFLNHVEVPIDLVEGDNYVRRGDPHPPIVEQRLKCATCLSWPGGGDTLARHLYTVTLGPRVEVAPFGQSGPYVGASAGVSTIAVEVHNIGAAAGLRAGYRFFPANMIAVGLGVSVQRIAAPESDAWLSMAALDVRGCFRRTGR